MILNLISYLIFNLGSGEPGQFFFKVTSNLLDTSSRILTYSLLLKILNLIQESEMEYLMTSSLEEKFQ